MNLTIALAINNIKGLEAEGRVEKLLKQVNYIGMLEHVVNRRKKIVRVLTIYPGKPSGTLDPQLPEKPKGLSHSSGPAHEERRVSQHRSDPEGIPKLENPDGAHEVQPQKFLTTKISVLNSGIPEKW